MSAGLDDRLIQMVNQIAANLAALGDERAAKETAQHLLDYWDPSMREAVLSANPLKLSDIARAAINILSER
ncbi:formate dehydrogenase subunit delta [Novosphingobium sp. MW5]|nr:formate dehydrogenase subunit delta [Novosphingobium sp. MW5]